VLGPFDARLDAAEADAYLDATAAPLDEDELPVGCLPPLQLGALLIEKLLSVVEIPRGLVHTGQSFEFLRAVATGTDFAAQLRVAQVSDRRGIRFGTVEMALRDTDGPCVRGSASLLAPLPDTAGEGTEDRPDGD
jgi:hypothetical protein